MGHQKSELDSLVSWTDAGKVVGGRLVAGNKKVASMESEPLPYHGYFYCWKLEDNRSLKCTVTNVNACNRN